MNLASYNGGQNTGFTKSVTSVTAGDIVTLAEAKAFCRITDSDEDTIVTLLIAMAEEQVENFAGITLRATTYTFEYETFGNRIRLPYQPIKTVTEVRTKVDGVETILDSDSYQLIGQDEKTLKIIAPIYGGIEIDCTAGYGVADVPSTIKLAILKTVLTNYENRQDNSGEQSFMLPDSAKSLLKSYKRVMI